MLIHGENVGNEEKRGMLHVEFLERRAIKGIGSVTKRNPQPKPRNPEEELPAKVNLLQNSTKTS